MMQVVIKQRVFQLEYSRGCSLNLLNFMRNLFYLRGECIQLSLVSSVSISVKSSDTLSALFVFGSWYCAHFHHCLQLRQCVYYPFAIPNLQGLSEMTSQLKSTLIFLSESMISKLQLKPSHLKLIFNFRGQRRYRIPVFNLIDKFN